MRTRSIAHYEDRILVFEIKIQILYLYMMRLNMMIGK